MTITLFIKILILGSMVSGMLTEAIKKAYSNVGKEYSANMLALIDAIVVGIGGTVCAYCLMGVEWTLNNIICMILMAVAVWIGSMIGYDKVIQLIKQMER